MVVIFFFAKKIKKAKEDKIVNSYKYNERVKRSKTKPANGKRRSKEEIKLDNVKFSEKLAERSKAYSRVEKIKQTRMGVKRYTWLTCSDEKTCPECAKNNGKTFSWDNPPPTGHPGEGKSCPNGHCRCIPLAKF